MSARLNLVVLRVADLPRARAFYETLGLAFSGERHGQGPEHLSASTGSAVLELYPRASPLEVNSAVALRLGFSVRALDQIVGSLRHMGVEVSSNPADSPWGRRAVVRDHDGHTVELVEAAE